VDRIRQTLDIAGLITHRKQSSNSCSFGLAVLTLWSMAWEGTMLPATFNRHNHPAFGIAVWLTLQRRPHTNFHVSHQELRRKFRTALEDSLASAMTLARGMNAHGIYLFEPRLLLPTIFDPGVKDLQIEICKSLILNRLNWKNSQIYLHKIWE
jgi:hypothetical protein